MPSTAFLSQIADSKLVRRTADAILVRYAHNRVAALDRMNAGQVQHDTLMRLVRRARDTRFGRDHDFARTCLPADPMAVPFDYAWLPYTVNRAYVAAAIGAEEVDALYERLSPYRDHVAVLDGSFACYGAVDYYLGLLAAGRDASTAAEHFARATTVHDRIGAKPWSARSRLGHARALVRLHACRARLLFGRRIRNGFERVAQLVGVIVRVAELIVRRRFGPKTR